MRSAWYYYEALKQASALSQKINATRRYKDAKGKILKTLPQIYFSPLSLWSFALKTVCTEVL